MKYSSLIVLMILSGIATSQVNLSSSLTACYALNGNAVEPINNLTGTVSVATPTLDRNNNANSALYFNGTNPCLVTLPNSSLLKNNTVSFSAWFKTNVLNSNQVILFGHNGCMSYHEGYQVALYNIGTNQYRVQAVKSSNACSPGTQIVANSNAILNANTWYHVGAYIGNDSLKVYLNGVLTASVANPNPLNFANTNVYLGGTNLGFNIPFNGSIDNVRFYNRKLNGSEFLALYNLDPSCIPTPVSSFSFAPANVCAGQSFSLTDLSTNTPTAWSWIMTGGTPSVSAVNNPAVSYSAAGIYSISLTASNGFGNGTTVTQTVNVLSSPVLTISSQPSTICVGSSATLNVSGANTYTWSTLQNTSSIVVSPTVTTIYFANGTATTGCQSTASVAVNVLICTSISESENRIKLNVYPNPVESKLVMETQGNCTLLSVMLSDISGQQIFQRTFETGKKQALDLSEVSSGFYFLSWNADGASGTIKVLKN